VGTPTLSGFAPVTPGAEKVKLLRVMTRCETVPQFVATFRRFLDDEGLFIVTSQPQAPTGMRQPLLIQLKNGTPVFRGEGEVISTVTDGGGSFKLNGMRVRILAADEATQTVLAEMRRPLPAPAPRPAPAPPPPTPVDASRSAPPVEAPAPAPAIVEDPPAELPPPPVFEAAAPAPAATPEAATPPASQAARVPETRAPGAAFTLPANPFSELGSDALEHFVDCTLYEDSHFHELETLSSLPGPSQPATSSSGTLESPPRRRMNTAQEEKWFNDLEDRPATASSPAAVSTPAVAPAPPAPAPAPRAPEPAVISTLPVEIPARRSEPRQVRTGASTGTVVAIALFAALLGGGLALGAGYYLWVMKPTSDGGDIIPTAASVSMPSSRPPAPIEATTVKDPVEPVAVPTSEPGTEAPVVATPIAGDCSADLESEPDGVEVRMNGQFLGRTPLAGVTLPCGDVKLLFERVRYQPVEKTLSLVAGTPGDAKIDMARPEGQLALVSSPPGASFTMNGSHIGRAPTSMRVLAYTQVKLAATLEGHKPWSKTVYLDKTRMTVTATMVPLPPKKPVVPPKKPTGSAASAPR
jgi:hypothetical protein